MSGIYIASKTKHAALWRALRDAGAPIISTWIDEAGEGESSDLHDLWDRCISESKGCETLIVYREPEDVLKGAWVEIGAALAVGRPVHAVGLNGFTISNYRGIKHFPSLVDAFAAAGAPIVWEDREMSDWQLIKTAPRDGSTVLLWAEAWEMTWGIQIGCFEQDGEYWATPEGTVDDNEDDFDPNAEVFDESDPDLNQGPTHWMPLPIPPSERGSQ